jgi:hypothetical protein
MAAATTSRENLSAALTIHLIIGLLMDGERQISSSRAASVGKLRAAVLRRSERRRLSSASDDEVGGFQSAMREQLRKNRPDAATGHGESGQ